jgi:hypothetical protein
MAIGLMRQQASIMWMTCLMCVCFRDGAAVAIPSSSQLLYENTAAPRRPCTSCVLQSDTVE